MAAESPNFSLSDPFTTGPTSGVCSILFTMIPHPSIALVKRVEWKTQTKLVTHWVPWRARVTAYTEPSWGGAQYGLTASGVPAVPWVTIAAPASIPFHTVIRIPGFGVGVVQDRGGAIFGNRLDVCLPTKTQDFVWGVQHETVWTQVVSVVTQKRWMFRWVVVPLPRAHGRQGSGRIRRQRS